MNPEPTDDQRETRLNAVLATCLEAVESGQEPERELLVAQHPEFASELAEFFGGREQLDWWTAPLRAIAMPGLVEASVEAISVDTATPASAIRQFGDYELLEKIGQGGMGVVWKARQRSLNRLVAVKMLRDDDLCSAADLQRFREEAETVALLDHPHIVPVYAVGEHEGRQYFSMKLIEGGSLAEHIAFYAVNSRSAARLLMVVARAVHHGHQRGILHRDLKPSNILLGLCPDSSSEAVPAEQFAYVTDFGLAKRTSNPAQSQAIVGTASYMAPEQAGDRKVAVTTLADVYSLGAILYEMLSGRPPFRGETVLETLRHVREQAPLPPRRYNSTVDRRLEAICLKCLQKDPSDRYASADELAEDLENYLAHRWVNACSFNLLGIMVHAVDNHRDIVEFGAMGPMMLLFSALSLALFPIQYWLIASQQPEPLIWLSIFGWYVPLFAVFWQFRSRRDMLTTAAERHNWSIWIGHMLALATTVAALRQIFHLEPTRAALVSYVFLSAVTGVALFLSGSIFWGRYYLLSLPFFTLAALIPLKLEWAPLAYGLLATVCSVLIGRRLCRLKQDKS